jgi:arabinan endo-1,5-alpha-L-arabinosidase
MRLLLAIATIAFLGLGSCATPVPRAAATYVNPVLNADFPDPTVIKAPDGYYYGYATQTKREGKWVNIQLARSADLVHWQSLGDALPAKPSWASSTQDFWAPDVVRDGARYVMYYSAKPDTSDQRHGLCLGVATAGSPLGPFVDMGHPLECGSGFVNIDPMANPSRCRSWRATACPSRPEARPGRWSGPVLTGAASPCWSRDRG